MTVALLPPDQANLVEAVARRVVELLDERERPAPAGLVDAVELAQLLGVSRSTVYDHQVELGAVRLGDGPRAAVRFDVEKALSAWTARESSERSQTADAPGDGAIGPVRRRLRRPAAQPDTFLLPVRGADSR